MKRKYKLVGSAPDLTRLIDAINKKWCWNIEPVCEISGAKWLLVNKTTGKFVPRCRVVKEKSRYRFEIETEKGD